MIGLLAVATSSLCLWGIQILWTGKSVLHNFGLPTAHKHSTRGIYKLVQRRMPLHANRFEFSLVDFIQNGSDYDQYLISSTPNGKVRIEGTTLSAIAYG